MLDSGAGRPQLREDDARAGHVSQAVGDRGVVVFFFPGDRIVVSKKNRVVEGKERRFSALWG